MKGDSMNKERVEQFKQDAESWAEAILVRVIALPTPLTAVVTVSVPALAWLAGFLMGRP